MDEWEPFTNRGDMTITDWAIFVCVVGLIVYLLIQGSTG